MLSHIFMPKCIMFYCSLIMLSGCWDTSNTKADAVSPIVKNEPVAIARGKIDVSGGLVTLSALEGGVVSYNTAQPGMKVSRGQVLMQLEDSRMNGEKRIAASELNLAQIKYDNLKKPMRSAQEKESRLKVAAQFGAVQKQLSDDSADELEQKKADLNLAAAEMAVARERINALNERLSSLVVKAPYNGVIVSAKVQPGELVHSGGQVITLLPERPLIIRAEVNEKYLDRLFINMKARVHIDGEDSETVEPNAHLVRISPLFTISHLNNDDQQVPERSVECILEFTKQPGMLVGQRVIVEFYDSKDKHRN